jgi:hypothetical protein
MLFFYGRIQILDDVLADPDALTFWIWILNYNC